MLKRSALFLMAMLSTSTFSVEGDLVLEGERWIAKSSGYICQAYGENVNSPLSHADMNVQFEAVTTDYSLDNGLVKATFMENGQKCRYSALMFADNDAATIRLVQSKAFSPSSNEGCQNGREQLDAHLADNNYLYWGHPHHLTIMLPVESAESLCGQGATHVGLDFTVSGRIGK